MEIIWFKRFFVKKGKYIGKVNIFIVEDDADDLTFPFLDPKYIYIERECLLFQFVLHFISVKLCMFTIYVFFIISISLLLLRYFTVIFVEKKKFIQNIVYFDVLKPINFLLIGTRIYLIIKHLSFSLNLQQFATAFFVIQKNLFFILIVIHCGVMAKRCKEIIN